MISGGLKRLIQEQKSDMKKNSRIQFLIFFITVFVLLVNFLNARELTITPDMQFDYAKKLFNEQDYNTAMVEYKRFLHFFPDDARVFHAKYEIGLSFYNMKRFRDAAKIFNDLILEKEDHEYKKDSYFLQSKSFRQMGNYGYARLVLYNYLKISSDPDVKDRINSMLADLEVQASKTVEDSALLQAKTRLEAISLHGYDRYRVEERVTTIDEVLEAPLKSPAMAGMLAIVPGGGFLYCERYRDALVSFLLNGALIYASYEAFDEGHDALGGVLAFVETGFYTGNIYGSVSAAHKHNRQTKLKILDRKFDFVSGMDIKNHSIQLGLKYDF